MKWKWKRGNLKQIWLRYDSNCLKTNIWSLRLRISETIWLRLVFEMISLSCASTESPPVKFINYELWEWVSFRKRFLDCWRTEKRKAFEWRGLFNVRIKNCRSLQRKGIPTEMSHLKWIGQINFLGESWEKSSWWRTQKHQSAHWWSLNGSCGSMELDFTAVQAVVFIRIGRGLCYWAQIGRWTIVTWGC